MKKKTPALKSVGGKVSARGSSPSKKAKTSSRPKLKLVGSPASESKAKRSPQAKSSSKTVSKSGPKVKKSQTPPPAHGSNVLWKFLQMKEERRKQAAEKEAHHHGPPEPKDLRSNPRHHSFSRFAGPRRRSV